MAELDDQGNEIVADPPDPVVEVTAQRDEMAGRASAAEQRAKDAEARAQAAEDLARQFMPKPPIPPPTGLTEEQLYEIQTDPAKFEAWSRQIAREEAQEASAKNMQAVDQRYGAVAAKTAERELAASIPDWDKIGPEVLALAAERKMTAVDLLATNSVDDAANMARGRLVLSGKYGAPASEEEEADDGRSAMLAHGTTVGGGSAGKRSEWDGFSEEEKRIAKQDGLKPDEFKARYLDKEPGDFVSMPRKKAN
jgi:hypothetical protein